MHMLRNVCACLFAHMYMHVYMQMHDTVPERLRRWDRNKFGSARKGSNPPCCRVIRKFVLSECNGMTSVHCTSTAMKCQC